MDYFPHDTRAMSDSKVLALRMGKGLAAVACYWAVLERIYSEERPFELSETNVEAMLVSLLLGIGFDELSDYVFHMVEIGLLERDAENPDLIMSCRAREQIEKLDKKRETARQNGKKGGRKPVSNSSNRNRKPKETDVGSSEKPKSAAYKTLNGIGLYKNKPIPIASGDADADESAPPAAVHRCPLCNTELERTGMPDPDYWWCDSCGTGFPEEKAVLSNG